MPSDDTMPRRNWWSRNWKWFVPVACAVGVCAFVAVILALLMFFMNTLRSATPYREAVQRTRASPAVVAAIGVPIETGWFFTGHIEVSNDTGSADFDIPVHGPKGAALIHVRATKSEGKWHYSIMRVRVEATQQRIDLLQPTEKVRYDNPNTFQARASISNATYAYTPAITSSSITPSPP